MDQQRMEEDRVPLLHDKVHTVVVLVVVLNPMVHLVNSPLQHTREAGSAPEEAVALVITAKLTKEASALCILPGKSHIELEPSRRFQHANASWLSGLKGPQVVVKNH